MYEDLLAKVRQTALEAADVICETHGFQVSQKGEKDFVTEIDLKISDLLCETLPKLIEGSTVISEEGRKGRPERKYCWVIDPVDGTSNLIYDLPAYAISIGLLEDKKPVLGVVYNPKTKEMFWAAKGLGAFCNEKPITVCRDSTISETLILAETNPYCNRRENPFHEIISEIFCDCIDYRVIGSAALDCCYVACGRGGALISQNLKPWDYAAGEIILEEAGGFLTQWTGEPVGYYGNSTVLASNGLLHKEILSRLKKFT